MNQTVIKLIEKYQSNVSGNLVTKCRHKPTCSNYAKEAFETHNLITAFYLSSKRILSCNPLFKPSYDPVPKRRKKDD